MHTHTQVVSIDIIRSSPFLPPTRAQLTCVLEVPNDAILQRLLAQFDKIGFGFTETISNNNNGAPLSKL